MARGEPGREAARADGSAAVNSGGGGIGGRIGPIRQSGGEVNSDPAGQDQRTVPAPVAVAGYEVGHRNQQVNHGDGQGGGEGVGGKFAHGRYLGARWPGVSGPG